MLSLLLLFLVVVVVLSLPIDIFAVVVAADSVVAVVSDPVVVVDVEAGSFHE